MGNSYNEFDCLDCGVDTDEINEYYMIHDDLWILVHPIDYGMLCIGCLEKRLNRRLSKSDFTDYPINDLITPVFKHSERLVDRLTS